MNLKGWTVFRKGLSGEQGFPENHPQPFVDSRDLGPGQDW